MGYLVKFLLFISAAIAFLGVKGWKQLYKRTFAHKECYLVLI